VKLNADQQNLLDERVGYPPDWETRASPRGDWLEIEATRYTLMPRVEIEEQTVFLRAVEHGPEAVPRDEKRIVVEVRVTRDCRSQRGRVAAVFETGRQSVQLEIDLGDISRGMDHDGRFSVSAAPSTWPGLLGIADAERGVVPSRFFIELLDCLRSIPGPYRVLAVRLCDAFREMLEADGTEAMENPPWLRGWEP
jgi:hypothetical protein